MHLAVGVDDALSRARAHARGSQVVRAGVHRVVNVVGAARIGIHEPVDVDLHPAQAALSDLFADEAQRLQHAGAVVARQSPVELDLGHAERVLLAYQRHAARRVGLLFTEDACGGDHLYLGALGVQEADAL